MACTVYTRGNTNDENNGTQLHLQRKKQLCYYVIIYAATLLLQTHEHRNYIQNLISNPSNVRYHVYKPAFYGAASTRW